MRHEFEQRKMAKCSAKRRDEDLTTETAISVKKPDITTSRRVNTEAATAVL